MEIKDGILVEEFKNNIIDVKCFENPEANINELCLNLFFPNINVLEFSPLDNFVVNIMNVENNKVILCIRTTGNIEKNLFY